MVSILPTAISTTQEYCMTQVFSLKLGFRTTILFSKSLKFFFFLFSSWMTRAGIFFSFIVSWCLHQRVNLCSCWLILPCERPYFLFIAYLLWSHHWSILPGSRVDQNLSNVFHHLPALPCTEKSWQFGVLSIKNIMSKHLSNSERLRILEGYLSTSFSKYAIQNRYGLSRGPIPSWLRKFSLSDKPQAQDCMKPKRKEESRLSMSE